MSEPKSLPAPKSLGAAGRRLWRETTREYDLRQHELESLRAACAEADLIERMEEALEGESLTVNGSQGQLVAHPLVQELRQHRATMAGLIRGLKLPDIEAEPKTNAQRAGGQARWAQAYGKGA